MSAIAMYRQTASTSQLVFASLVVFGVLSACASSTPRPQTSAAASETPAEGSVGVAPECLNDEKQHVQCLSDGDCCAGFVCGKDPELNQSVSYCVYGG